MLLISNSPYTEEKNCVYFQYINLIKISSNLLRRGKKTVINVLLPFKIVIKNRISSYSKKILCFPFLLKANQFIHVLK